MKTSADLLGRARVHVGGTGRIGSEVVLMLHAAGIGYVSANDQQNFEKEQLWACGFSRRSDLGRAKVHVLERFLDGRPDLVFEPIVARNESAQVIPYLRLAHLIVSCANDLNARLYMSCASVKYKIPCIQASAQDGRYGHGGLISIWIPDQGQSCFGCLLTDRKPRFRRGELLLPTVTTNIASLAANLAVEILNGRRDSAEGPNVFAVDLDHYAIEALSVKARPGCSICGSRVSETTRR